MQAVAQPHFRRGILELLKETFEGPAAEGPSAFLMKGTGLFQTLDELSAEVVSAPVRPGGSTVAAHTEHLRFYVAVHHKLMLGSTGEIDWDESWLVKTLNSDQWDELRQQLRQTYSSLIEHLSARENWSEEEIDDAMAIIAHTAYHLGAIRQLLVATRN